MERDNETKREDDGEEGQDALTPLETAIGAMISEIARAALLRGDDRPVVMTITFAKPGGKDSPPTSPGGDGRDTRIEVFRVDSRVILQVGLPGADPGTLHIGFGGGHIRIMARCGSVVVRTGAPVPPPEPGTITVFLHNGLLEISYRERGSEGEENSPETPIDA